MTSIVIHYKELALKGKNRPWFIQLLVRNLKTALAGLHVASVRSSMGRIELELRPDAPWDEVRERLRPRVRHRQLLVREPRSARLRRRWRRRSSPSSAIATPASFRVSATRSDKRLPFTSPQVEREVGGLIKEAKRLARRPRRIRR